MTPEDETHLDAAIQRGLDAIDAGDPERAEQALEDAQKIAGENHPRTLHLAGLIALDEGQSERGLGFLMQAADLCPPQAEIYLDCAEAILITGEDVGEAEVLMRQVLELEEISDKERYEAKLTLAQVRLQREDVSGALELLDELDEALADHPAYLSTRGGALLAAGRGDEAVAVLERAIQQDPEDSDLLYQLALTLRELGREDEARLQLEKVRELDARGRDEEPLSPEIAAELRARLDEVLSDLPEPLLQLIGGARVEVQQQATAEQVAQGGDPRSSVIFVGQRASEPGGAADLETIVLLLDVLAEEVEDDDDISLALFYGLVEEIRAFFRREDVLFAGGAEA